MQRIKTNEDWGKILKQSKEQPILLLKFSMTCISSISALKEFKALNTDLPKYLVIVQLERDVSNFIENDLGVKHESPQFLILLNEKGIWQATHYKIKRTLLTEAIHTYVK
ncbi:bacillithiol system redox-active protein YtxJ [Lysinibacillus parviboronicapiens]|uniref:Bacillithiol system protein YtxJ n=1 Tax=Lysinibacillus parviboronicapiens TaxID=436516 RepID=A0ABV2PKB7_9BACI|nr:bacillithiol system redox-active protein YtxJ [Lysinibacillus parviboronicapiens]